MVGEWRKVTVSEVATAVIGGMPRRDIVVLDFEPVRAKMYGRWRRGVGVNQDSPGGKMVGRIES